MLKHIRLSPPPSATSLKREGGGAHMTSTRVTEDEDRLDQAGAILPSRRWRT